MRATLKIENRTRWRTDHLRAFAMEARRQVFGADLKPQQVRFVPARVRHSGLAAIGGSWSVVRIPSTPDKHTIAQVLVHEFAHNAGAKGERWMRRGTLYGWGEGWRENVAWAEALPLELQEQPAPASREERVAAKLASIEAREVAWRSKLKRANTALRKLAKQRAYYTRRAAALHSRRNDGNA